MAPGTRARLLAALVLLFLIGCSAQAPSPTSPASTEGPPATTESPLPTLPASSMTGSILFARAGGKYHDETFYVANADGSNETRITDLGAMCCPRWSSDGESILGSGRSPDGRITTTIMSPDGSDQRLLPLPAGTLQLGCMYAASLASGLLACEGWSDREPERDGIYVVKASDGRVTSRVTRCCAWAHDIPVDFSPDGTRLYFFRAVEGFPSIGDTPEGSLFVAELDGSGVQQLTPSDLPVEWIGGQTGRLSRDGASIVFTSDGAIWTVGSDGSNPRRIFEDGDGRQAITPTWSPDGRYILFGLDPAGSLAVVPMAPHNGLYVVTAAGESLTPLIVSKDWKREPDWIP